MTHGELCKATAERFIKDGMLALYEYQSYATGEFPDVLIVGNGWTTLYEIKTSRSDFLADSHKDARTKWRPKGYMKFNTIHVRAYGCFCPLPTHPIIEFSMCKKCEFFCGKTTQYNEELKAVERVKCNCDGGREATIRWITENPELYYIEKPHLGELRYFVCEGEIIKPEDLPEGWGLYWVKGGRFYLKQESKKWRPNVFEERNIITHAFRRWVSGDSTGILVNSYAKAVPEASEGEEYGKEGS